MISLEMKINDKILELDIYIPRRFPEEGPKIFGKRRINSFIVNQETNELVYQNLM